MVFLYNSDNNAPYFDSILFRGETLMTFSFVLENCPEAMTVLHFVGYVPVGSPAVFYPLYSAQAGLSILRPQIILSGYLQTPCIHHAAYEQGPDLEVPIYVLEPQSHTFNLPFIGRKLGHDGNHYLLYTCVALDYSAALVHLALHPTGYQPIPCVVGLPVLNFTSVPPMSDTTFGLTLNSGMVAPRSILESCVRSPTVTRLHYNPISVASRAHSSTADSSESGLVRSGSIIGSSILETSCMGSSAYPAYEGDAKADLTDAKRKPGKLTLTNVMEHPNWGKALANLRCMIRVIVCRRDNLNLFLLVTADHAAERKALINSLWPDTLTQCDLQQKDLEKVTMQDKSIMSEVDILALGDPWFSLWMYDNKHHAYTSIMNTRAGFDLKDIFGIALQDKVMLIISRLRPPQSNCLPLADNGLIWFLRQQITTEMVYHVVFRQNAKPRHRICLADLDPAAFRQAAYPPVATLSLVVTSCYEVLLDFFDTEFKDFHGFISASEMHTQICKTLPVLFEQSDDPDHAPLMTAMKALCIIKKGDVQRVRRPKRAKK